MNKITKETIKRIKAGNHDDLMEAIEFLIDTFEEDKWEAGYEARIQDESVVSQRLAEHILKTYKKEGIKDEDLAKIIEDYYTEALKEE